MSARFDLWRIRFMLNHPTLWCVLAFPGYLWATRKEGEK